MTRNIIISFSALFTLLTAGCSTHNPTVGDRIIAESTYTQELGDQWNKGMALVSSGQKLSQEGREQLSKGTRMISKGQQMIKNSEALYKERYAEKEINKF